MARITFVENRGKTQFWNEIAKELLAQGNKISWLVQNPAYGTSALVGTRIILPFPKSEDLIDGSPPDAVSTDRGRVFFGAGSHHYTYYDRIIDEALQNLHPDVVIGEPTLFHELLTIKCCRKRNIPYLHPTMTRYPSGRFMLLDGDTQIPAFKSNECWEEEKLESHAKAISEGRSVPSYMVDLPPISAVMQSIRRPLERARTAFGRFIG